MTHTVSEKYYWWIILALCLASRLLTTIYYIEDPDSLRFALAALDYDVAKMQPHFPAYPVFCGLVKSILLVIPRYALAFSIVGGLSTFVIIYCGVAILKKYKTTPFWQYTLTVLVFFNPLIWLLGNRYMPDLMGLAMVMITLYFWAYYEERSKNGLWLGLSIGILIGVRLSYLPMVFLPAVFVFFYKKDRITQLLGGLIGVLIWLVPLLIDTGWADLVQMAQQQTDGHFNDFGGTVQTEAHLGERFEKFILHGWADGLGGYWQGRHWSTIIISLGLALFGSLGVFKIMDLPKWSSNHRVLFNSIIVYTIWIFFYQNVVFKSRHHLPLIMLSLMVVCIGAYVLFQYAKPIFYTVLGLFLTANIYLTTNLIQQHKKPVAISQLKDYLQENITPETQIITSELVQFYLTKQGVKAQFLDINNVALRVEDLDKKNTFLIANFKTYKGHPLKPIQTFYHNPYVNRMWSSVVLNRFSTIDN